MRLIAPSDYRRMPWKNGGGATYEVAVHPSGADWGSFAWRVSIADIASSGEFSSFPGIDRRLVVLGGHGMVLTGVREEEIEVRPYDCVDFAGEAQVGCRLVDGPTRDFNVMTRRGAARADVRVVRNGRLALDRAATYVCHAVLKPCACIVDGTTIDVPEAHTLVADVSPFHVDASRDAVAVVATVIQ
jgi:environmental stress-induced protein Ves